MSSCYRRFDPGPCPVDDTPHTACTPASVAPIVSTTRQSRSVTVPIVRPGWVRPPVVERSVVEVSTATYKRPEHVRKSFGRGARTK